MKQVITTTGISITNANPHRLTSITEQMNQVGAKFDGFPVDGDQSQTRKAWPGVAVNINGRPLLVKTTGYILQAGWAPEPARELAGTLSLKLVTTNTVITGKAFSNLVKAILGIDKRAARRKPLIHNGRKYKR